MFPQLSDDLIGYGVSLLFCQAMPQPAHDLDGTTESEGNLVSEHVSRVMRDENIRELQSSR